MTEEEEDYIKDKTNPYPGFRAFFWVSVIGIIMWTILIYLLG